MRSLVILTLSIRYPWVKECPWPILLKLSNTEVSCKTKGHLTLSFTSNLDKQEVPFTDQYNKRTIVQSTTINNLLVHMVAFALSQTIHSFVVLLRCILPGSLSGGPL